MVGCCGVNALATSAGAGAGGFRGVGFHRGMITVAWVSLVGDGVGKAAGTGESSGIFSGDNTNGIDASFASVGNTVGWSVWRGTFSGVDRGINASVSSGGTMVGTGELRGTL